MTKPCPYCNGRRRRIIQTPTKNGYEIKWGTCPDCEGRGKVEVEDGEDDE